MTIWRQYKPTKRDRRMVTWLVLTLIVLAILLVSQLSRPEEFSDFGGADLKNSSPEAQPVSDTSVKMQSRTDSTGLKQ